MVGLGGDCSGEDPEWVFLDEAAEGGEGGFGVGGAEVHAERLYVFVSGYLFSIEGERKMG